jgi:hypothetical protein
MIVSTGTLTLSSTSATQLVSNTTLQVLRVLSITIRAEPADPSVSGSGNDGIIRYGVSDNKSAVTNSNGYPLLAGEALTDTFSDKGGAIKFSQIYVAATSAGDKVNWRAILV